MDLQALKQALPTVLALPDLRKPFSLYIHKKRRAVFGVFT
jgi:hypothetical protein